MIARWLKKAIRKAGVLFGTSQEEAFPGSEKFWEQRYSGGGNSGAGSYGKLARYKADFINDFVKSRDIRSVMEFGCGDGNQLTLANYPTYVGLDVSPKAIELCKRLFAADPSKRFLLYNPRSDLDIDDFLHGDLTLSLDVIYHLIEDEIFSVYMSHVFERARRHVIVYSSDRDERTPDPHVRHRCFSAWVAQNQPAFRLEKKVLNPFPFDPAHPRETSFADFFVFIRTSDARN